jgi:hypothetical protein
MIVRFEERGMRRQEKQRVMDWDDMEVRCGDGRERGDESDGLGDMRAHFGGGKRWSFESRRGWR